MLQHAFKEWAVICRALALGQQSILLRKGGIAEATGNFEIEHTRFWLYPTYLHENESGLHPQGLPLLREVQDARPPAGVVRLSHFAEVAGVYQLHDMVGAMLLRAFHIWSDETVASRFRYRRPGLNALVVRVYSVPKVHEVQETPAYAGCRSWVELEKSIPTERALPVLDDKRFAELTRQIDSVLKPTALA